jgi:drug/metabolite transporter (DMT)-like permease
VALRDTYILLFLAMIFWGLSWPSSKVVTAYTDSSTLLFFRFLFSSLAFLPIIFVKKIDLSLNKIKLKSIILGGLFFFIYNQFFFLGLANGYSGVGGVLVTTLNPIITLLLSVAIGQKVLDLKNKTAIFLGLFGGAIILQVWQMDLVKIFDKGNAFFVLAALSWSFVALHGAKNKHQHIIAYSFYSYLICAVLALFATNPHAIVTTFDYDWKFWSNMLFISVIVTTVATTFYIKATSILGASNASSFILLVPIFALFSSVYLLDEPLHYATILGGILSILAIYLMNKK